MNTRTRHTARACDGHVHAPVERGPDVSGNRIRASLAWHVERSKCFHQRRQRWRHEKQQQRTERREQRRRNSCQLPFGIMSYRRKSRPAAFTRRHTSVFPPLPPKRRNKVYRVLHLSRSVSNRRPGARVALFALCSRRVLSQSYAAVEPPNDHNAHPTTVLCVQTITTSFACSARRDDSEQTLWSAGRPARVYI